jgi:membrane associated rhomboid family serine protease
MRIGKLEAWVERCAPCERYWVERMDRRSLEAIAKSAARQRAFESLSPAEKKELAGGLAEAVAEEHAAAPQITPVQAVLAALGIPMLERVEGNRVPWMTWLLTAVVVLFYVGGRVWPEDLDPRHLAWTSDGRASHLLWANFIHFNFFHLLGNVAFLLAFGDAAEQRLHRRWLVIAFVVLGPLTLLIQDLFTAPGTLIGGASGAICVLVGASIVLQRKARVIMFFFRLIPVRVPVVLFGVVMLTYQGLMALFDVPGVGWYAHLSGLAFGVALAFVPQTGMKS